MYKVKKLLQDAIIAEQIGCFAEARDLENHAENKYNEMVTGNTLTKYELYDLFGLKGFH